MTIEGSGRGINGFTLGFLAKKGSSFRTPCVLGIKGCGVDLEEAYDCLPRKIV